MELSRLPRQFNRLKTTSILVAAATLSFNYAVASTSLASHNDGKGATVIHAGTLLAEPGKKPLSNYTVVIESGEIKAVEQGFVTPNKYGDNAQLIDLKDSFVMPGLMDMHVHLQMELGPHNTEEIVKLSDADVAMQSVAYAKKTLQSGFTTVRDLLSKPEQMYALRDGVEKGWIEGPRIIAAAGIAITGGHLDVDGMAPDLLALKSSKTICDGPYECRKATRLAIKYGADAIKVASTGGVLSDTNTGTGQQMTNNELKEIVDTAHALGRKVASHAHATAGINAALRAGVDSIEHGSYADKTSIKLFKKNGAYLVPTLLAGATVVDMATNSSFMSAPIKAKAIRVGKDMLDNFNRSYKAGVKIAFGTDSGVSRHGTNAQEAVLMHKAGMPAAEILKSATVNGADLIGMSDKLGTIEVGKYADIIALDNSPLEDISELLDVDFVMKAGKVYKHQ
ncbi:amidohydrolase family protein [Shewanella sp. WXL01]|uniref:Amidohydrolase family protein n=1 Tax=Shewanella maritima TaxID=2520507 RepID=A0A411PLH9_9GAMM|nr:MULTISPECIES: amidohydrolase family protein [Shewanella]NKF52482.1 amidohydrolase family protein [Shewanella sp. WXL01]QBF84334.1 amidohydrolase family protein [Shewanella maritima]